ncbi:MAG: hypothetical protein WD342_13865 [Verrucomicrobiales bacterium]
MQILARLFHLAVFCSFLCLASCETLKKEPAPERERLSSMPHNMPESWEGQAGMPGQMGAQY